MTASPLQSLTADDIERTIAALRAAGKFDDETRVAYMGIREPDKLSVLVNAAGVPRETRSFIQDYRTGTGIDVVVAVDSGTIVSERSVDGSAGRVPILHSEFEAVDAIVSGDPQWVQALAKRGLTPEQVRPAALSAGDFSLPGERDRRVLRIVPFMRDELVESTWAHPIGGLCAYYDVDEEAIYELVDDRVLPVPAENSDFDDPAVAGPTLAGLKPIEITQPQGPSFTIEDEELRWANWRLRVGFDHREGLVLRTVSFADRSILYRGSIAEMVVPYGDPQPAKFWLNYFDVGEFVFGRYTNSLQHGCDCLGDIRYLDATLSDEFGVPRVIPNAVCIHEEDAGILWKHTDEKRGLHAVRRNRRLVVSFFTTVGNYDYGFYWYFYLDGTIECEAKLTGLLLQQPYPPEGSDYQSEVAPGLGAPYHQHLFSARLDVMIDGLTNAVDEIEARRVPIGPGNRYGNAFSLSRTRLQQESDGARSADASRGRTWHIVNTQTTNRTGAPVGYMLYPQPSPSLLADAAAAITSRATFATKELWVTKYDPDELYPAGDYVNQNPGGHGLPEFVAADRSIDGEDIVLWHTFGVTHFPRVEDWPVMPVDTAAFALKPFGFFDKNPALNVPAADDEHCAVLVASEHEHHAHDHAHRD